MKQMTQIASAQKAPLLKVSSEPFSTSKGENFRIRRSASDTQPILIVEDEFLIAADLEAQIRDDGGRSALIALSISDAEQTLQNGADLFGVVLDVNVGGTTSFGLADRLVHVGLPFVFFTGYLSMSIPDRFIGVPRVAKPASWRELKKGLAKARDRLIRTGFGSFRDSVEAALPALRYRARGIAKNHEEADQLVERTLERAISAVGNRSLRLTIEDWLLALLERTNEERDDRMLH
jgi:DNA-binding LytR/AlgR family response regulator